MRENMVAYPYGKFGWIIDPEENKIELWDPWTKKICKTK